MTITKDDLQALTSIANNFANKHRLNADDVLDYIIEKIIPIEARFDETYNVPKLAYIRTNAKLLCKNFLRDDANLVQIRRRQNYLPVAVSKACTQKPYLRDADDQAMAKALHMSLPTFLQSKAAVKNRRASSFDEHPFLQGLLGSADKEPCPFGPKLMAFMEGLSDKDFALLTKYTEGKTIGKSAQKRVYALLHTISELRGAEALLEE